eukprot:GHVN01084937.1.p1 GENE.GHVN01084937.1~~GHVN01084937.1.p1  ORF type:complete len:101 (+),score=20.12 GHVN01084937.1:222-524(+)
MGVIRKKTTLEDVEELAVARFCRRRLATVLKEKQFCQRIRDAVELAEQGHVRIGPTVVNNPALHVTPDMEDHLNWAEGSKVMRHVKTFNEDVDDYDLLGS